MHKHEQPDRFDDIELKLIEEALDSNDLWPYVYGSDPRRHFIHEATERLRAYFKRPQSSELPFVIPTSSGTASIHVALGGLQIPAGSEVLLSPITDIGTVTPIIAQNLIPVFADVGSDTGNINVETIKAKIFDSKNNLNKKISAVIVVHLTGSPVDMEPIMKLCKPLGIKVIEDTAQGLGALHKNQRLGTFGDAGCFSLNSQKHITTGEGGFVIVHEEDEFYRCHNFSDKHRDRFRRIRKGQEGDEHSKYMGLGMTYRMSELNGAMLLGQLDKLEEIASRRHLFCRKLDEYLGLETEVIPQQHIADSRPSFFFYMFRINQSLGLKTQKSSIIQDLNNVLRGKFSLSGFGGYEKPLYHYGMFQNKSFFDGRIENSNPIWPAELAARISYNDPGYSVDYQSVSLQNAENYYNRSFCLRIDERYEEKDAKGISEAILTVLKNYGVI